jgi:hypothetical protein
MPTKRQRVNRKAGVAVSPAAVEAYQAGDERALSFAIGQAPWEFSPLRVDAPDPPKWLAYNPWRYQFWVKAWEIRCALEAAIG